MACLAVFGRGPGGGLLANPHIAALKAQPDILRDIYMLAGIAPAVPVQMGLQNFRVHGTGTADATFVCLDAFCRRVLPVYLGQLDHNVAQVNLAGHQNLGAFVNPTVTFRHFVHRQATNSAQHGNNTYAFGGTGVGFGLYYTFGNDTFNLVMEVNGNFYDRVVPRALVHELHWLIRMTFTLAWSAAVPNAVEIVPHATYPGASFPLRLDPSGTNYNANFQMGHDLANTQLLCGPCNGTKNAGGVPLALQTLF